MLTDTGSRVSSPTLVPIRNPASPFLFSTFLNLQSKCVVPFKSHLWESWMRQSIFSMWPKLPKQIQVNTSVINIFIILWCFKIFLYFVYYENESLMDLGLLSILLRTWSCTCTQTPINTSTLRAQVPSLELLQCSVREQCCRARSLQPPGFNCSVPG